MKEKTLTDHLLDYLKEHEGTWVKKVALYVVSDEKGYSPESCGRYLRNLANQEVIQVEYYDSKYAKHLAQYSYNPPKKKVMKIVIEDGIAKQYYV